MVEHACPACGSGDASECLRRKDGLQVYECRSCGLRFVDMEGFTGLYGRIERLYEHDYYEGSGDLGYRNYAEIPLEEFLWQRAFIELSAGDLRDKRILDVGCGTGNLIRLLNEKGAHAEGQELSMHGAEAARTKGLTVTNNSLAALPGSPYYDIITAFDLIEHIPDVRAFLAQVHRLLDKQGVFVFSTPDAGSIRAVQQGEGWYGFNSSLEHIHYFSKEPLSRLLEEVFGSRPALYQAVAPDGEAVLGFVRKGPSMEDGKSRKLFASNFAPELITAENALQVCILLHRMADQRLLAFARRFGNILSAAADEKERRLLSLKPLQKEGKISVRLFRNGDEQGIRNLFREVFGREMTKEEWSWKYRPSGEEKVHSVVAVTEDNTVIAHYGGIPLRLRYNGTEIRALVSTDVMTLPRYRGFVTLRKIMRLFRDEALKEGFRVCHGFPTERTLMQPAEKLRIIERCTPVLEACAAVSLQNTAERLTYHLLPIVFDDERIDSLWKSCGEINRFAVIRDRSHYRCRYGDHPRFPYQCWGLGRRFGNKLFGLAVVKVTEDDTFQVMDLLFQKGRLEPLLRKLMNLAHSHSKKKMVLWLPRHYHESLKALGFTFSETATLARFIGDEFVPKEEMANAFYFTMGDTDYI